MKEFNGQFIYPLHLPHRSSACAHQVPGECLLMTGRCWGPPWPGQSSLHPRCPRLRGDVQRGTFTPAVSSSPEHSLQNGSLEAVVFFFLSANLLFVKATGKSSSLRHTEMELKADLQTSLLVQWLRIYLPGFPGCSLIKNLPTNAGEWVSSLVWEDPTCHRATKPMHHNY